MRRPGACHHARFLAQAIYHIKMVLLCGEFNMCARIKRAVLALTQFIVLIYGKYFLQCPLAVAAARLDRQLWQDLVAYQAVYPDRNSLHWRIAEQAKKILSGMHGI